MENSYLSSFDDIFISQPEDVIFSDHTEDDTLGFYNAQEDANVLHLDSDSPTPTPQINFVFYCDDDVISSPLSSTIPQSLQENISPTSIQRSENNFMESNLPTLQKEEQDASIQQQSRLFLNDKESYTFVECISCQLPFQTSIYAQQTKVSRSIKYGKGKEVDRLKENPYYNIPFKDCEVLKLIGHQGKNQIIFNQLGKDYNMHFYNEILYGNLPKFGRNERRNLGLAVWFFEKLLQIIKPWLIEKMNTIF